MELSRVLKERRSIRRFKQESVPKEALIEMIEAARIAPSGKNLQNWHFIVITNVGMIHEIKDVILNKNEEIAKKIDEKDSALAMRFRKRARANIVFFVDAPVLIVAMTMAPLPTGYPEQELAGEPQDVLNLLHMRSPGMQSLGAGIENLSLRCADLGYGSCWMTGANYAAPAIERYLQEKIGFSKEDFFMGALIAVGVPNAKPSGPPRKSFDDICTFVE
jgi:nitroreductase